MIDINAEFLAQMKRIADALEKLAGSNGDPDAAPDLRAPIEDFLNYDWEAIGATVVNTDREGPSTVEYQDKLWTRRSGNNPDFGAAIWFSRAIGKDDKGQNRYACLVKFQKVRQAKALPENAAELAAKGVQASAPAGKAQPAAAGPATPPAKRETPQAVALREQFVKLGTSRTFNLSAEAVNWLFDNTSGDVELAQKLLPIMAEAKANGMKGVDVTALFRQEKFNPEACLRQVRAAEILF